MQKDVGTACQNVWEQGREYTNPHPCILFTLEYNCHLGYNGINRSLNFAVGLVHCYMLWLSNAIIIRILCMIQFNIRNSISGIYDESNQT